jgi:cell division protein FtsB
VLKLPKIFRNRYALVGIGFIVYIAFIDAHDLITQFRHKYKLHQIEKEMGYLDSRILEAREQTEELTTNKASLEKHAREQYRMKRENEEIFVILYE